MESRAAKLALARQKLKDHQVKKLNHVHTDETKTLIEDLNNSQIETKNNDDQTSLKDNIVNIQSEIPASIDTPQNKQAPEGNTIVTEMLISNKRNLESQISDLQIKLLQQEESHALLSNDYKKCCIKISNLENELQNINDKYEKAIQDNLLKTSLLNESEIIKSTLSEKNNNLGQQLELVKSIVSAKESESDTLHSQLRNIQHQYDLVCLQLQQQASGPPAAAAVPINKEAEIEKQELLQKVSYLEQQINFLQKEKDQLNLHYEHFVSELNAQLKLVTKKNEELSNQVQHLSIRENNLIEQIGEMEIRIQNFNPNRYESQIEADNSPKLKELELDLEKTVVNYNQLQAEHKDLQLKYATDVQKLQETINQLSNKEETTNYDENISMSKLTADMTSDKIAAQRATEQNKKLKHDLQELEDAFVKMSKDKLELTEKLTAEKYLNRELTIKLAEIDENAKNMQQNLKAKDEEMMRLQTNYRELEQKIDVMNNEPKNIEQNDHSDCHSHKSCDHESHDSHNPLITHDNNMVDTCDNKINVHKEDAMSKLQERFLKIMNEVADLSDEKHRLEHIIVQLQTETDTICEYVALYQQQRSLLKRRDEERSVQLKLFQQECAKLEIELEELTGILIRLSEDKELLPYLQTVTRKKDLDKIMTLLLNLKNNSLINPEKKDADFKNFYPCHCCSGKLIEV